MRICDYGYVFIERIEPCFFNTNCKGCSLCDDGFIIVLECENEECIFTKPDKR